MFNRTAAAEVNQRLAAVEVDGQKLTDLSRSDTGRPLQVASTFHKFALDINKLTGEQPQIISEAQRDQLIGAALAVALDSHSLHLSPTEHREMLGIVSNFVSRAGQQFPGHASLSDLRHTVGIYCDRHRGDAAYARKLRFHEISLAVYEYYLSALRSPQTDFNLLMSHATEILRSLSCPDLIQTKLSPLKYILIDEYQDFSYLFFSLVEAIRSLAPGSHLFVVGDDWQAINRFAGSDVNYFIHFADYFPDDMINIPLATNYRSNRRIVETANLYMLTHYDPEALPAKAHETTKGKVILVNPSRLRVDSKDTAEDALGDGRYIRALEKYRLPSQKRLPVDAVKLLKATAKIIARHPYDDFMLLHRHNFTSFEGISLATFTQALVEILSTLGIMSPENFARQIRCLTMHKSKGLEAENVILLEFNREIVQSEHPHATIFELFGDTRAAEIADQQRLIYVALTRAKKRLYLLSKDEQSII